MGRTTLYHRTDPPRIVEDDAAVTALLAQGWADTPAAFYAPVPDADKAPRPKRGKGDA